MTTLSTSKDPKVAILMGSDSDLPVMAEAARIFEQLGVPYELAVTSAHRSPQRTIEIVRSAADRGVQVFICGAGSAAHLAGVVAAHTTRPVLGVPLASSDLNGLDALLATVQMPAGIPVGTLAIGKAGAANSAWLAASIVALSDAGLAARVSEQRESMGRNVQVKSAAAQEKLDALLGSS